MYVLLVAAHGQIILHNFNTLRAALEAREHIKALKVNVTVIDDTIPEQPH